jgi:hypothetical protein
MRGEIRLCEPQATYHPARCYILPTATVLEGPINQYDNMHTFRVRRMPYPGY